MRTTLDTTVVSRRRAAALALTRDSIWRLSVGNRLRWSPGTRHRVAILSAKANYGLPRGLARRDPGSE